MKDLSRSLPDHHEGSLLVGSSKENALDKRLREEEERTKKPWQQIARELNAATDELKADNDRADARERCLAKIASLRNGIQKRSILRKLCALRARARYNPARDNYDPYWLLTLECGVWK